MLMLENRQVEEQWQLDLDYSGENNFASFFRSNGVIHSYPAKAVPEMVNSLITKIKESFEINTVLDPFVGSGTVAVEAKYMGLDFYGSDLNPLSILLSRTKTLTMNNGSYIEKQLRSFSIEVSQNYQPLHVQGIEHFNNISYWFKEDNIKQLSYIKSCISDFLKRKRGTSRETFALILLTAFSTTIRSSSLTRNGEFKLYRISPMEISNFSVNSIELFQKKIEDLLDLLEHTKDAFTNETKAEFRLANAKSLSYLKNKTIDLVITSPPYGDSQSTVAYGQFSRLSIQWMQDLLKKYLSIDVYADNCDEYLLGGNKSEILENSSGIISNSKTLSLLDEELKSVVTSETKKIIDLKNCVAILLINSNLDMLIKALENDELFKLIKERIRLDIYRKLNSKANLPTKKIKEIAKKSADRFMSQLSALKGSRRYRKMEIIKSKLPFINETLERRVESQPERYDEIIKFFRDLYSVVKETDRVLASGGVQAWIVGHRTVLGKVTINLMGVLQDWFENLGYRKITSLNRQYSFKRLPHHINSTITRNDEIKTMMQEYILVVQKK
ncbi:DNA methyltransferase [Cohnella panacarvi]|uniref:DNA methyltransferase n=1 Tax=Cohnella panacarvi TaxID=400776 RepID=UPI00047EE9B8|nr:DNA methyltransferase [Cohnella panacarvi]